MILEDYLRQHALQKPGKTALVCQDKQCSYGELYQRVMQRADIYRSNGYRQGQVVCLRTQSTISHLVDYFALHIIGAVAAPLEYDMPAQAYDAFVRQLNAASIPADTADILYTTGSTGQRKGVVISHRAILADAENLIAGHHYSADTVFVVGGPLNHIGSLSKVYPVIMQGATLIVTDGMADMNAFLAAFDYPSDRMATFLVPASIRMLLAMAASRLEHYAPKVDFIETGAAAIAHSDMLRLCQLMPQTRLYNTYASTETGVVSTYNFNDGACLPGCLGTPLPHSRIAITAEGLVACQGNTLMTGYAGDDELTAQVMRQGTVYTRDMGFIDSEGRLFLQGRQDDVINVGGYKVAPDAVESAALSLPEVIDCVCIPVPHPITGHALKLLVVLADGVALDKRRLARQLLGKLERHMVPQQYEQTDYIRRTFNGKTDRHYYIS